MGRMFDAVTKIHGEIADVAMPVVARAARGATPHTAGSQDVAAGESSTKAEGLEVSAEIPTIGEIRTETVAVRSGVPVVAFAASAAAVEQYRIVRTRILQHPRKPALLLVSSPGAGDGKTITAINLAGVLGLRDNASVLLMDTDLRRSNVAATLGIATFPGLVEVVNGQCALHDAIMRTEQIPNLYVLPAGNKPHNAAELLDSPAWNAVCATVRESFDFVICDAPPVAVVADYELLQAACDGVVLVVRPDHTGKTQCMKAISLVPDDKLLGTVVNCAPDWILTRKHHGYAYYQLKA